MEMAFHLTMLETSVLFTFHPERYLLARFHSLKKNLLAPPSTEKKYAGVNGLSLMEAKELRMSTCQGS